MPEDSKPPPSGDRRRHERQHINKDFESFQAFASDFVTNISRSGIFIRSKSSLSIGTKVDLRFTVVMDEIEVIEGTGEVVRVTDEGMGIEFRELSRASQGVLTRLMNMREAQNKEQG
jgi:hypothetical protein